MTDSDTRCEQIARIIAEAFFDSPGTTAFPERAADALIAAGLIVPSGLTAEKLRVMAGNVLANTHPGFVHQGIFRQLHEWADALGVPEAKTETP